MIQSDLEFEQYGYSVDIAQKKEIEVFGKHISQKGRDSDEVNML